MEMDVAVQSSQPRSQRFSLSKGGGASFPLLEGKSAGNEVVVIKPRTDRTPASYGHVRAVFN